MFLMVMFTWGGVGVGLFFILSGASMYYAYSNKNISIFQFYKKRFISIYPMFWIALFFSSGFSLLMYGGMTDDGLIPFLVTILGMDGYFSALGILHSGFFKAGEWFLGCIIIIYFFIPFLIYGVKKLPWYTFAIVSLIFACFYGKVSDHSFVVHLPEIVFGMIVTKYYVPGKIIHEKGCAIFLIIVITTISIMGADIGLRGTLILQTLICMLLYLFVVLFFGSIEMPRLGYVLSNLAKYTYPVFLIHHQICVYMAKRFWLPGLPKRALYLSFLSYLVITAIMSIWLYKVNGWIEHWFVTLKKINEECE